MITSVTFAVALAFSADAGVVTKPPEVLTSTPPTYPESARKEKRGGVVGLRVTIEADGSVSRVDVVGSAGADLDWAALGALTQFTFVPAEIDGKPAAVAVDYKLAFELPASGGTAPDDSHAADGAHAGANARAGVDAGGGVGAGVDVGAAGVAAHGNVAVDEATSFVLSGRVRRAGTVEPLPGAEVSVSRLLEHDAVAAPLSTTTDGEGRFTFAAQAEGPFRVEVGLAEYDPFSDDEYFAPGRHDLDVALVAKQSNEFLTVVRRQRGEPPVSRVSLSREEVHGIPGTYGDALRVIESLPGVARAPLLGGALMVRGGYPADTAIHFEGVPIPVLYHFGGFTSVINGDFIETIDFMPGGFPVRYGNATAGIVDVKAHALDSETFHAKVDVDDFDLGFFFGGHVKPVDALPSLKLGFAARRSHAEIPASLFLSGADLFGANIPFLPVPLYYDYQLKLETAPTPSSTLQLFMFGEEDSWAVLGDAPALGDDGNGNPINVDDVLNTFLGNRFHRLLASWEYRPLPGVTNTVRPWIGFTRRGLLSEGVAIPLLSGGSLDSPTDELNWGLRDELAVRLTAWVRSLFGFEHNGAAYDIELVPGGDFLNLPVAEGTPTNASASLSAAALYAELQLGPIAGVSLTPGVRAELSSLTFADSTGKPIYDGNPKSIVDSWTVDPRVSLRWQPFRAFAMKTAFGAFHERPRAQSAAFDVDGHPLDSQEAFQVIGGFENKLTDAISIDAQVYGIKRYGLTREHAKLYTGAQQQIISPLSTLGSFDSFGSGNTLGFELFLRHAPSKYFFGWISYTFSRTEVSLGDHRERRVLFPFDQTHNLVAVGKVNLPWDVTLGARFAFVTGNPGPLPDSVTTGHDLDNNFYQPVLSTLQSSRLDPFHRLDLRVDKRFTFSWCSLVAFLEVVNVYNWPNPEVVFPGGDYRSREIRTLVPGPPILPLIGAELEL